LTLLSNLVTIMFGRVVSYRNIVIKQRNTINMFSVGLNCAFYHSTIIIS